jgi:hypothetical protein
MKITISRSEFLASLFVMPLLAQPQAPTASLDNLRIIELAKAGIRPSELIRLIATAPDVSFTLTPVATNALLAGGVSEDVIKAMAGREKSGNFVPQPRTETAAPIAALSRPEPATIRTSQEPVVISSRNGYKVTYDGGSIVDAKAGADLMLYIDATQIRLLKDKQMVATIPASAVTEISYGQDVHRRVGAAVGLGLVSFGIGALMALSKSKKHFVGLTWISGEQKGGFAMQCDKNEYRGVIAGIEGITGKKAVDSEAFSVKN